MSWRDGLGKGKYKTESRKRKSKALKIITALIILIGAAFLIYSQYSRHKK